MISLMLVLFLFLLLACSTNPLSMVKDAIVGGPKPGLEIDTELVLGNKDEKIETEVQLGSKQTAGTINNNQKEELPKWAILLIILGWMCPAPNVIYREVKNIVSSFWRKDGD